MKSRKFILMNRKGDFLIFWQNKKELFIESKYGSISTEEVGAVIDQLIYDLSKDHLFYIGDL